MNYSMLVYIIGSVLKLNTVFFLIPCITGVIYREDAIWAFLISAAICLATGILLTLKKPANKNIYTKEGFFVVALSWIAISIFGSLPFIISGVITNPVDALFEIVSGFTTTGASILTTLAGVPKSILLWRSFSHWIGGMGVLVFLMAVLPMAGGRDMHMMKAESPGPSVGKLVPHARSTAKTLYVMYIALTVAEFIILLIGKMPAFDALAITFGTAGTGGFGVCDSSIAEYSSFVQIVVTIFMILFGINFNAYFFIITKKAKQAFKMTEVRAYLLIIFASIAIIVLNTRNMAMYSGLGDCIKHTAFTVSSIITTTGYATIDFDLWPELSKTILVLLMFCGACAGSTGGGIKVSRILIFFKTMTNEIGQFVNPRRVKKIKLDGKPVEREMVRSVSVFLVAYVIVYMASLLIISLDNFSFTTNFTAVAATINNIGPGLEAVGPTQNFAAYSGLSKIVLTFDMLAGRLELFPMLVILAPSSWKK